MNTLRDEEIKHRNLVMANAIQETLGKEFGVDVAFVGGAYEGHHYTFTAIDQADGFRFKITVG
jgi:hypothetical protein